MNKANEHSKELLEKYLWWSNEKVSFFILSGPKGIWKSEIVINLAKQILWDFFYNDFLHIKDFSDKIGKEHELKVEYKDSNETTKLLQDSYNYTDIWTREINDRLGISPAGTKKIVLIENIERMNRSAVNAFLKTCEEPLQNRIIIATTSNKSRILDTIISRAIIIPFFEYTKEELIKYCDRKWYFAWDNNLKELVCLMSQWKLWTLDLFHEKLSENEELKNKFKNIIQTLENTTIWIKYQILLDINSAWFTEQFLDWLIAYYIQKDQFDLAQKRLDIRKILWTNVKNDNLLFSGLI